MLARCPQEARGEGFCERKDSAGGGSAGAGEGVEVELTLIQPVEREVDGELVEWSKRRVALALDLKNDFFKTHLQEEDGMKCHRIAQDLQKILNDMIKANSKQAEDLGAKYLLSLCTTREDNYGEVLASCLEIDSAVQDLQIIVKARDEGETIVAKCYKVFE
eukprot:747939-Hanusia_phi.AAC.5